MAKGYARERTAPYNSAQGGLSMEINLFDKVKIIKNGIFGTVVDIYQDNGSFVFVIESD